MSKMAAGAALTMQVAGCRSVPEIFLRRVEMGPDRVAYRFPVNGGWGALTWGQTAERVENIARGLCGLGVKPEERCAILSSTRLEWILADLAIGCAGGATTTVYPTTTPDEYAFILNDSASRIIFAEDTCVAANLIGHRAKIPDVRRVVVLSGPPPDGHGGWVMTLDELEAEGREHRKAHADWFEEQVDAIRSDHLATLIYTSGTTGQPKGVELTHDCWIASSESVTHLHLFREGDLQYLWLPLAHVFGKVLQIIQFVEGFPTAVDGRVPKLVENLAVVKPTFMAAAPRIFEKVHNKVVTTARDAGAVKYALFRWAVDIGKRVAAREREGRGKGPWLAFQHVFADALVLRKVRARFGGNLRFFISGSAPLSMEMAEFFDAIGIHIMEGYGLTESSAASFVNRPDRFKFGTVGVAFDGVTARIAEDGEILLKGRTIMRGYHNLPEETAAVLQDGWLHTGDIGELDDEGFLKITDRKKDLIKTSGGKYVAPQFLEGKIKALCPYVSQVVVHGNARKFVSALVTLDEDVIRGWAAHHGLSDLSPTALVAHEKVNALVKDALKQLNAEIASHQQVKRFAILPEDFTQENGLMTPSMKVRRKAVEERYKALLDGFYAGDVEEL